MHLILYHIGIVQSNFKSGMSVHWLAAADLIDEFYMTVNSDTRHHLQLAALSSLIVHCMCLSTVGIEHFWLLPLIPGMTHHLDILSPPVFRAHLKIYVFSPHSDSCFFGHFSHSSIALNCIMVDMMACCACVIFRHHHWKRSSCGWNVCVNSFRTVFHSWTRLSATHYTRFPAWRHRHTNSSHRIGTAGQCYAFYVLFSVCALLTRRAAYL